MKSLVGLTVTKVETNPSKTLIRFHTDKGEKTYYTYGDCCSRTWIENISGLDTLLNSEILSVEDTNYQVDDISDFDVLKYYSCVVKTSKGRFEIEYRNSSNGYYGGDLQEVISKWDKYHSEDEDWSFTELTSDF